MIDAQEISRALMDCLHTDEEAAACAPAMPEDAVRVEVVMHTFIFHPARLESHRAQVIEWIRRLPVEFLAERDGGKGGWSFLRLAFDRQGNQWGEHLNCDELLALAFGLGLGRFLLPRAMWSVLPGSMPYVLLWVTPETNISEAHL